MNVPLKAGARFARNGPVANVAWNNAFRGFSTQAKLQIPKEGSNDKAKDFSVEEQPTAESKQPAQQRQKTISELDEELRLKMAGLSGDGGESGVEYEDGQPVAMKRSVKNNMFRYI